jgi:hypothetical protein
MQLSTVHHFAAPLDAVYASLSSADYLHWMVQQHSFFEEVRVISLIDKGDRLERTLRYRAQPFIRKLGMFSLPTEWFAWFERSELAYDSGLLRFDNMPESEAARGRVTNRGWMRFREQRGEDGSAVTVRESQFDFDLLAPAIYRPITEFALSMVARQLGSALDEEALLLHSWLSLAQVTRGRPLALSA